MEQACDWEGRAEVRQNLDGTEGGLCLDASWECMRTAGWTGHVAIGAESGICIDSRRQWRYQNQGVGTLEFRCPTRNKSIG